MKHRRKTDNDTVGSSGWLYADLLLGLAMLFLVGNSVSQPEPVTCPECLECPECPECPVCPAPVVCPPTVCPEPSPLGLDTTPDEVYVYRMSRTAVKAAIEQKFGGRPTRRAGVVLTFGKVDPGKDPSVGSAKSIRVNRWLKELYPSIFGSVRSISGQEQGTVLRNFLSFSGGAEARLEIYWFQDD